MIPSIYLPTCPHFDYCSPVWSKFTAHHHISFQILHNKLARWLLHADIKTAKSKMLEELMWATLGDRWKHQLLLVAFLKCLRKMVPVYMPSFTFIHSTHDIHTRSHTSNSTVVIPPWNIMAGFKRTFEYRAVTLWKRLLVNICSNFMNMSLNEFKHVI